MKCLFSFHSVHFLLTHLQNWHIFTQPVSLSPFFLDTFAKLAPFHFDNFHSVSFSLSQCREVQRLCYLHSANYLLPFITQSFFTQSNSLPMFTQSLFTQPNFLPPYHPANMHPGGGGKMWGDRGGKVPRGERWEVPGGRRGGVQDGGEGEVWGGGGGALRAGAELQNVNF